jgi:hypothetical protein
MKSVETFSRPQQRAGRDSRQTPRVQLRRPIEGTFDGVPVLVLELGLGGAKIELAQRMEIGRAGRLAAAGLSTQARVAHSILLPARESVVYQTGLSFTALDWSQRELLLKLLFDEAQEQVQEWEANLAGVNWRPKTGKVSAVSIGARFTTVRLTPQGWEQSVTSDPNQPVDGVSVVADTSEEELNLLRRTYEKADHSTRELLRRLATVAILERLATVSREAAGR